MFGDVVTLILINVTRSHCYPVLVGGKKEVENWSLLLVVEGLDRLVSMLAEGADDGDGSLKFLG